MRDGTPTLDTGKRYMRDLPYSWDFLVENLIDPAHVNYAHNGVIGSRCTSSAICHSMDLASGGCAWSEVWQEDEPLTSSIAETGACQQGDLTVCKFTSKSP